MNQIICCLKKDIIEIIRNKRIVMFNFLLFGISAMVLITTLIFPDLISILVEKAPDIMSDGTQIEVLMQKLFPQLLKENMGIWSADVGIFFTIIIALVCGNIIPAEIKHGKWILVIEAGYHRQVLIGSKIVIYGIATAFPVFIMYNLYYGIAGLFLISNYSLVSAVLNSIVLSFVMFSIAGLSISLSVICKNQLMASITIITTILAAPDILTLFSFGKIFPTHLLTFVYESSDKWEELIIPFLGLIVLQYYCYRLAVKKSFNVEIAR